MLIRDVLAPGLRVVFCGTALGTRSARVGAYYAGPGNRFWPTLHEVGLTPVVLRPDEYPRLLDYGIGLTDICKTRSGSDEEVGRDSFDVPRLVTELERHSPAWIAFNGKCGARGARPRRRLWRAARDTRWCAELRAPIDVGGGPRLLGRRRLARPGASDPERSIAP